MEKKIREKDPMLNLVLQELKENPRKRFKVAFSLMTIIPFLVFFYLLASRLFTLKILVGDVGLVLIITVFLAFCGFYLGYSIINNILKRVISYAAQAKHSDQLKSTFVATVSHELKNPLTVMQASLDNIYDGLAGTVNPEQKKIIEICHNIILRLNHLINDLLDLHKIEAGMSDTNRRLCNILDILDRQIKECEILMEKKRIKLHKDFHKEELSVWADEGKIAQVINNLLSNAIKYTPEGGSVNLKIFPLDKCARIEISDTGPGIPEEKREKIFDKFERLDYTKEGTGLGLAIAKDIVELHKGRIWVESVEGLGSKFIVVLPSDLRQARRK